jgi:hypothetical protein
MDRDNDEDGKNAPLKTSQPSEFERTDAQIEVIRRLGGIVGPPVGADDVDCSRGQCDNTTIRDTCASTSTGSALNYLYALKLMHSSQVALSTDFALHDLTRPRVSFGCGVTDADRERDVLPDHYQSTIQIYPVNYRSVNSSYAWLYSGPHARRLASTPPMTPAELGTPGGRYRKYDFNFDGLAHYGLLPDLLQDTRNLGVTPEQHAPLFRSAEAYIKTWEKAWQISHCSNATCGENGSDPIGFRCTQACRDGRCGFATTELASLQVQRPNRATGARPASSSDLMSPSNILIAGGLVALLSTGLGWQTWRRRRVNLSAATTNASMSQSQPDDTG